MADAAMVLECRGLTVRFGGVTALSSVDFTAGSGRITSIIGPNGAGKTTLLNAVSGMVRADSGRVFLRGGEISCAPAHARGRLGITRTFQNLEIFGNMSVIENVLTGCHRRVEYGLLGCLLRTPRFKAEESRLRGQALDKLDFVGLADKADSPATDLPFGSQRLLETARALAAEPVLLLLDEPAAGLNMRETRRLAGTILRIRDELGVSIVLVEHDMDLVMHVSDHIMVLNYGEKIAEGTPREVQSDPRVVAAYLGEPDEVPEGGA
jgi:branched-chain amino acid transport system ATP-binding protein